MEQQGGNRWDGKRPDPITERKESFYDKLLSRVPLTVKALDIIIVALIVLAVAVAVLGYIKGNA